MNKLTWGDRYDKAVAIEVRIGKKLINDCFGECRIQSNYLEIFLSAQRRAAQLVDRLMHEHLV